MQLLPCNFIQAKAASIIGIRTMRPLGKVSIISLISSPICATRNYFRRPRAFLLNVLLSQKEIIKIYGLAIKKLSN